MSTNAELARVLGQRREAIRKLDIEIGFFGRIIRISGIIS